MHTRSTCLPALILFSLAGIVLYEAFRPVSAQPYFAGAQTLAEAALRIPPQSEDDFAEAESLVDRILLHQRDDTDIGSRGILSRLRKVYAASLQPIQDQLHYSDLGREVLGGNCILGMDPEGVQ